jgi:hypothetical protein
MNLAEPSSPGFRLHTGRSRRTLSTLSTVRLLQVQTLKLQELAKCKWYFALYNCLVLGHTKYKGVHRIYCNPFHRGGDVCKLWSKFTQVYTGLLLSKLFNIF